MKWSVFNLDEMLRLVFVLSLFFISTAGDLEAKSNNEEKLTRLQGRWAGLMPKQSKIQFAGSMGMFSVGPGWYYGKKEQWETDWFIGFIPKMGGREGHITTTLKQTYSPFKLRIKENLYVEPLTAGIYINKIFGPYFWSKLPERYPKDYYFWAVNTRFNISLGQVLKLDLNDDLLGKDLSLFYEFNTNDLYFISAIGNQTIRLRDIIGFSFGVRYRIF
ncbi:MAG: hypothetical protein JNL03_09675 [Prolixibacteraceae bacterium]|nr:hypothetical protein [Prolixibacteraceae bacterium]